MSNLFLAIKDIKLAIYEKCITGEITVSERDLLLENVNKKESILNDFFEKEEKKYGSYTSITYYCKSLKLQEADEPRVQVSSTYLSNDESIEKLISDLKKNFGVLKRDYKKIIDKVFDDHVDTANDWDMEVSSGKELRRMCNFSSVSYYTRNKDYDCMFELWFNDGKNSNSNFFGDHSLVISIYIKNGKVEKYNGSIEG